MPCCLKTLARRAAQVSGEWGVDFGRRNCLKLVGPAAGPRTTLPPASGTGVGRMQAFVR
jgi:hypothetical protein